MKKITKKQVEAAQKTAQKALSESHKLSELYHDQEVVPLMRKRVGECFRYRNTYGSGEPWWMYIKIIGILDGRFCIFSVQLTSTNRVEISTDDYFGGGDGTIASGYEPISARDFDGGTKPILQMVANYSAIPQPSEARNG